MKYLLLSLLFISQTVLANIASWYGNPFHGRLTANGEKYNMYELTCAHKTLPFGTKLKVTNKKNKKSVIVRANDRGPFVKDRVVDLSKKASSKIECSLCEVTIRVVYKPTKEEQKYKRL
jgi:rare lipoprotein A